MSRSFRWSLWAEFDNGTELPTILLHRANRPELYPQKNLTVAFYLDEVPTEYPQRLWDVIQGESILGKGKLKFWLGDGTSNEEYWFMGLRIGAVYFDELDCSSSAPLNIEMNLAYERCFHVSLPTFDIVEHFKNVEDLAPNSSGT